MFKRIVDAVEILALLLAAVLVVLALSYRPSHPLRIRTSFGNNAVAVAVGQQIFSDNCSGCHGSQGEGNIGPRLAGIVAKRFPNAADEVAVVRNGRGGMPAWDGRLTPAQIEAVVAYTRRGL